MNKLILSLALLGALIVSVVSADDNPCCERTSHYCKFRFSGYSAWSSPPIFDIGGTPDQPISPRLKLSYGNKNVESANSRPFYFIDEDGDTEEGSCEFEDHQFYVTNNRVQFSTFNRNPASEAAGRCVVIPLSSYKLQGQNYNCNYPGSNDARCVDEDEACVVFGTEEDCDD